MWDQEAEYPVYIEELGLSKAEVYLKEGIYWVFVTGDQLACFLGSSSSMEDCKEEIKSIRELAQSDLFQQAIASTDQALRNSGSDGLVSKA